MNGRELKQKIRNLKKLELRLRYGYSFDTVSNQTLTKHIEKLPLVWKDFFGSNNSTQKVKYPFAVLENMSKAEVKKVFEEFWLFVYLRIYQEQGIAMIEVHQAELLQYLDLPLDADKPTIKKKFRELCKVYHPDAGGDSKKFLELMEVMKHFDSL